MQNIAMDLGKTADSERFGKQADLVGGHYLNVFYRPQDGYLTQAVTGSLQAGIDVYQNTNTIALDYVHGRSLLEPVLKDLARFQASELYHTTGHRAVPLDSRIPCEMWHSCHMNQHLGHECKLARMSGLPAEADRVMEAYLKKYGETGTAVETFNFTGCDGDQTQLSEWQTFSATAAIKALISGVAGMEYHRGGINYIPAAGNKKRSIRNFVMNGKIFDLEISGDGDSAQLYLNGKWIPGTLQIPVDLIGQEHNSVEFRRCGKEMTALQLLQAEDLPISRLEFAENSIRFTAEADRYTVLRFRAEQMPAWSAGEDNDFKLTWNPEDQLFLVEGTFRKGEQIKVSL